jgi:hypothetical protein
MSQYNCKEGKKGGGEVVKSGINNKKFGHRIKMGK